MTTLASIRAHHADITNAARIHADRAIKACSDVATSAGEFPFLLRDQATAMRDAAELLDKAAMVAFAKVKVSANG